MPGFITHYLCAQATLSKLSPEIQSTVAECKNIYNIGAQGPDIFFYYLPGLIKKRTKNIGVQLHRENAGGFLLSMADGTKKIGDAQEQAILFSYTAGFLSHYALDVSAHPYVYALTTVKERAGMHNRVEHRKLETAIDVLMLKLMSGKKPAAYALWQLICADAWQMRSASGAVSSAIQSVYGRNVQASEVYKAMRYMVQLTRILQSGTGRRKRLMELVENHTVGAHVASCMVHAQRVDDESDCLNMKKTAWHPTRNDSFVELYQAAVDNGIFMIDSLFAYLRGEISRNALIKIIGNRSLQTGEIWEAV
jgi:hypothetical protein